MDWRTRAKLSVLLFAAGVFSVVLLPNGAGRVRHAGNQSVRQPSDHAGETPVNFHGSPAGSPDDQKDSRASIAEAALLGGTCINCHVGITPAHTKFALKCVDATGVTTKSRPELIRISVTRP